jgi:hypothetical protein
MNTMHGATAQETSSQMAACRNRSMRLAALTWVWLLGLLTVPVWGGESNQDWSDATKSGIGCLVASGAALTASLWAGPNEIVMIAAGGSLVSSGTTPLLVALTEVLLGVGGDRAGSPNGLGRGHGLPPAAQGMVGAPSYRGFQVKQDGYAMTAILWR